MEKILDGVSHLEKIISLTPSSLANEYPDFSIFFFPGKSEKNVAVSCLLHGNEISGFLAIKKLLKDSPSFFENGLILMLGNLTAAKASVRHLPDQPDHNRIWNSGATEFHKKSAAALQTIQSLKPFCLIDLHNNTGRNPFYSCLSRITPETLSLAGLFANTALVFEKSIGALIEAVADICPAIALEAGLPGNPEATPLLAHYLYKILTENNILDEEIQQPALFGIAGELKLRDDVGTITADATSTADVILPHDLDSFNFRKVPAGSLWAHTKGSQIPFKIFKDGNDFAAEIFENVNGRVLNTKILMPAMLTLHASIKFTDGLGYLLKDYP